MQFFALPPQPWRVARAAVARSEQGAVICCGQSRNHFAHRNVVRSERLLPWQEPEGELRGCSQQPNAKLQEGVKNNPGTGSSQTRSLVPGGFPPPHGGRRRLREPALPVEDPPRARKMEATPTAAPGKGRRGPVPASAGDGPALHPAAEASCRLYRAQIVPEGDRPQRGTPPRGGRGPASVRGGAPVSLGGACATLHPSLSGGNWPTLGWPVQRPRTQRRAGAEGERRQEPVAAGSRAAGSRAAARGVVACPSAMNAENFGSTERLVTAAYVRQGAQGRRAHELRLRALLEQVTGAAPPGQPLETAGWTPEPWRKAAQAAVGESSTEPPVGAGPAWGLASEPPPAVLRPARARPERPRTAPWTCRPAGPRGEPGRSSPAAPTLVLPPCVGGRGHGAPAVSGTVRARWLGRARLALP